jgi:hypothetical protein
MKLFKDCVFSMTANGSTRLGCFQVLREFDPGDFREAVDVPSFFVEHGYVMPVTRGTYFNLDFKGPVTPRRA